MKAHIVFDVDGTITDTQKIHQQIESDFLKTKWVDISPQDIWTRYAWRSPSERIPECLLAENRVFDKKEVETFVSQKDDRLIGLLEAGKLELMPYAFEILTYLHNKGYKIGLSSGACREFIDKFIIYFKLEDIIVASTSANEVEKKKPNPDVFLASFDKIEKIYGKPDNTYVVWDGWSDIEWGHKAWAKTIWLNYGKKKKVNELYCDREIESLKELYNIL